MFLKELPLDPLIIAFSAFCFSKSAAAIYTSLLPLKFLEVKYVASRSRLLFRNSQL
jgi:hypothetical protein